MVAVTTTASVLAPREMVKLPAIGKRSTAIVRLRIMRIPERNLNFDAYIRAGLRPTFPATAKCEILDRPRVFGPAGPGRQATFRSFMPAKPGFTVERAGDETRLNLGGDWTLESGAEMERASDSLIGAAAGARAAVIDLAHVERMDTGGAWLIDRARKISRRPASTAASPIATRPAVDPARSEPAGAISSRRSQRPRHPAERHARRRRRERGGRVARSAARRRLSRRIRRRPAARTRPAASLPHDLAGLSPREPSACARCRSSC